MKSCARANQASLAPSRKVRLLTQSLNLAQQRRKRGGLLEERSEKPKAAGWKVSCVDQATKIINDTCAVSWAALPHMWVIHVTTRVYEWPWPKLRLSRHLFHFYSSFLLIILLWWEGQIVPIPCAFLISKLANKLDLKSFFRVTEALRFLALLYNAWFGIKHPQLVSTFVLLSLPHMLWFLLEGNSLLLELFSKQVLKTQTKCCLEIISGGVT